MAEILELSDQKCKMINMLRDLLKKWMSEQMGHISREMEVLRQNLNEILETKNIVM